jgi:NADP-dependent 3-hydroxy acid dehydrogenase YdfG
VSNTIFITGSSSGIGKATALYFQKNGWNVIASMRSIEKGKDLQALEHVLVVAVDVTKPDTITLGIEKGIQAFGSIDVFVNNAGYGLVGPFEGVSEEQMKKEIETNVLGVMQGTKAILPYFRKKKTGIIVNVASMGGRITFPLYSVYHASKWAVEGFSESLQHELIPLGIRIKIIEPGTIKTNFYEGSMDLSSVDSAYKPYVDKAMPYMQQSGKTGSPPEEIAKLIFKAATDTSWRLRYSGGKNARLVLWLRKLLPDGIFNYFIRFAVLHNLSM